MPAAAAVVATVVERVYREESRRVLATLIRLLGDFDLAEEALHEAFRSAVEQWPRDGVPDNPRAWLVSAGRFRTIDALRRRARFDASLAEIAERLHAGGSGDPADIGDPHLEDDRLRLLFTCCHPALAPDAQVALALREICGLTTGEIASAFLVPTPTDPEARGLLALMLLHDARRRARTGVDGDVVLLDAQDRTRWDRAQIGEGLGLVRDALRARRIGPYTLQAAIAAVHAEATDSPATDWNQIIGLYGLLMQSDPSPVVALNRAVAVAMRDGAARALPLVDALLADALGGYHLAHATRADLCRRLGRGAEALASYRAALALARQEPERRFLTARIHALEAGA